MCSLVFLLSFLSIRLFLISTRLLDLVRFECGLFGLIYRFLFIVRTFIVTNSWIQYFAEDESITFMTVLRRDTLTLPGVYVAVKALFIAILVWDLETTREKYRDAYKKSFIKTKGKCNLCENNSKMRNKRENTIMYKF